MTEWLGCPALGGATRRRHREVAANREWQLKAALAECRSKGFAGARAATMVRRVCCNIRMIYP